MTKSKLDSQTVAFIQTLVQAVNMNADWRVALDKMLIALRAEFVFDNVAIYMVNPELLNLDIIHARAVGRGKAAEADAAWGEGIANQVVAKNQWIIQEPENGADDRLSQAHLLGVPLYNGSQIFGAMVFIRFGGPLYENSQTALAVLAGSWVSTLLVRKNFLELRDQLNSLHEKVQFQDDFLATISHELRTPLGFIKGYSTTLLRSDTTWDPDTSKEFLTIIDEEADRLAQLIDNILESAKLQSRSAQLSLQPLSIDALIRDVVLRVRTHHKDLQVELQLGSVPPIQGDIVRLTQVLDNLFSNAIKYAQGAKIIISTEAGEKTLLVTFTDQGPGIPQAYLPYIFERFYRVPGDHSNAGSGLGLYICNQIIRAHRGKIWVESELDEGTTFFIMLPLEPAN